MADRDDNYRGYGRPSGRYYENREYGQGYGGREERGGLFGGRDRDDDRSRYGGRDNDGDRSRFYGRERDDDRRYGQDRDNDRGFFERAGQEIRSWFSDDDDRYGRDNDRNDTRGQPRYQNQDRERGYGLGSTYAGGRSRDDYPQTTRGEDQYRGGARYGATSGSGAGSRQNQYSQPHDEHYSEWRNQQVSALDRDYDEYRRENRDKFHSEFTNWRGQREQQRSSLRQVREHQEVVGSDGEAVGTVDKIKGDKIILTKSGPNAGGHHHSIPCSWIQTVDEKVTINKTAADARKHWTDEETRRALFESEDDRNNDGPHILHRSFSGTYGN